MRYSVSESTQDGFETVELADSRAGLTAVIVPRLGNNTIALQLKRLNFLWRPNLSLPDLLESRSLFGIPFLAPWANRLSESSYWVDGCCYKLNPTIGNLRFDHHGQPIHGLLLFEPWKVCDLKATENGAEAIAKLNFTSYPKLMAQFPFAHSLEMRHLVQDGRLRVTLRISSECAGYMPVSVGFHPYYTIPNSHRDGWRLTLSARKHFALNQNQIPTGSTSRVEASSVDVRTVELDDVYSDLERNQNGEAGFEIRSLEGSLELGFGPLYKVAVIYAPHTRDFVCVEPMAAVTDALNLWRNGAHVELQTIEPGGSWEEEFWVEPSISEG
jgi:aldose 1-epimerase